MQRGLSTWVHGSIRLRRFAAFLGVAVAAANPASSAELRCPPRLPGLHPGFEQMGPVPAAHWLLWRMRLFDGAPGEELKAYPAELAPDSSVERNRGLTSTWRFAGKQNLLMVCTYDGSGTYYRARVSPIPKTCTLQDDGGLVQAWCDMP
jgi:hypothetical protein